MNRKYKITIPTFHNSKYNQIKSIKKELHKYHPNIIRLFVEKFPATQLNCYTTYYKSIESDYDKNVYVVHGYAIWYKDSIDFWYRWNRFKKLIPFL